VTVAVAAMADSYVPVVAGSDRVHKPSNLGHLVLGPNARMFVHLEQNDRAVDKRKERDYQNYAQDFSNAGLLLCHLCLLMIGIQRHASLRKAQLFKLYGVKGTDAIASVPSAFICHICEGVGYASPLVQVEVSVFSDDPMVLCRTDNGEYEPVS
jgi:hypothetical protein